MAAIYGMVPMMPVGEMMSPVLGMPADLGSQSAMLRCGGGSMLSNGMGLAGMDGLDPSMMEGMGMGTGLMMGSEGPMMGNLDSLMSGLGGMDPSSMLGGSDPSSMLGGCDPSSSLGGLGSAGQSGGAQAILSQIVQLLGQLMSGGSATAQG